MNASQRLFDRFEKAGPSWLPIIVLSIVGLVSTILCVRAVHGLAEGRLPNAIEATYLRSRETGQQDTLLFAVSEYKPIYQLEKPFPATVYQIQPSI